MFKPLGGGGFPPSGAISSLTPRTTKVPGAQRNKSAWSFLSEGRAVPSSRLVQPAQGATETSGVGARLLPTSIETKLNIYKNLIEVKIFSGKESVKEWRVLVKKLADPQKESGPPTSG